MDIEHEFSTVKDLVIHILEVYPDTRNSDTYLYQKCCEELGAKYISDISIIGLNMITVHKIRQVIQNKENIYPPIKEVKERRMKRADDIKEYMLKN